MKTEDEARKCWCPFARCGNEAGCNRNGEDGFSYTPHCIASDCAAWRWVDPKPFILTGDGVEKEEQAAYDRLILAGWTRGEDASLGTWMLPPKDARGYCGLAGKP